MAHVLSERSLAQLKILLDQPCQEALAMTRDRMLDWALDPEYGGLPPRSATAFADWLNEVWEDWTEEPEPTVKDILEGAVTEWCGGRVMPS